MIRLLSSRNLSLAATALVLLGLFTAGSLAYPYFASWSVARNLLVDNAFLAVAACGATFVILSGGIDLSVGSLMAFTSILIAALVERGGVHPLLAILIALGIGTAFGAAQGLLVQVFQLPSFLVTLAGMFFARGAAFAVCPHSLGIMHPFVAETLNETLSVRLPLGPRGTFLPITVFAFILVFALAHYVLGQLRFGRAIYALGDDEPSARLMGLPIAATRVGVFAVSGVLSAFAGVLFTLYQQSGDPAACKGLELDAIAAAVIGGTLLRGGVGSVVGTLMGVLILGLIQTIITFQGNLSSWWTRIVVGALVLCFLGVQRVIEVATRKLAREASAA